jgi:sodium pump decarboxylase gamma subunit
MHYTEGLMHIDSHFLDCYNDFRIKGVNMTILKMLGQSGILAFLGMGVVFGFLAIMVIVINLAGKIIKEKTALSGQSNGIRPGFNASASDNGQVTAAISAAVNEYRKSS